MNSVIDVIRNASFYEQKHDLYDFENENEFIHPFCQLKDSFDLNENEEITFSEVHEKTMADLRKDLDNCWRSLDEHFENLRVTDDNSYDLPLNTKNRLKEMLFKPDLTIKSKETRRKYSSSSSSSKFKPERKLSSVKMENLRDTKERKLSVLFNIKRKRSSVDENVEKKIEESMSKINKNRTQQGAKDRKYSASDLKMKDKDIKGSVAGSRKYSTISESVGKRSKKLELNVDDFLLSSPYYNLFDNQDQQLDKHFLSWNSKERARKKVTKWTNKYL